MSPATPKEQLEQIINQYKEHRAYKEIQKVRTLINASLSVLNSPVSQQSTPEQFLGTLRNELKKIMEEIDNGQPPFNEPNPPQPQPPPQPPLPPSPEKTQLRIFDTHETATIEHLAEQYKSQIEIYRKIESLGLLPNDLTVDASYWPYLRSGKGTYALPDWSVTREMLVKKRDVIREKSAQGFRKLLIVPFACDLLALARTFDESLVYLNDHGGILNSQLKPVKFPGKDLVTFIDGTCWDPDANLSYIDFPLQSDGSPSWQSKNELTTGRPWQIYLVEDHPVLEDGFPEPDHKESNKLNIASRPKLSAGSEEVIFQRIRDFNKLYLFNGPAYGHERLMHPETYLWMQLTSLLEGPKPILLDHIKNNLESGTILGGCITCNPVNSIPFAGWHKHIFTLGSLWSAGTSPTHGLRTCVPLK